jgi:hypothetical protein
MNLILMAVDSYVPLPLGNEVEISRDLRLEIAVAPCDNSIRLEIGI